MRNGSNVMGIQMKCQRKKMCKKQPGNTIIPTKAKWCTGCDKPKKDKRK